MSINESLVIVEITCTKLLIKKFLISRSGTHALCATLLSFVNNVLFECNSAVSNIYHVDIVQDDCASVHCVT